MPIECRNWTKADSANILHLLKTTWIDTYSRFIPLNDIEKYLELNFNPEALSKMHNNKNINGYVAELDNDLAGFEKIFFNKEENRLYVQQLYILPRYQGIGIGKELLKLAVKQAASNNLDRIWIGVMVDNFLSLSWYKHFGYQIVEKSPFKMGNTTVDHYIGYVPNVCISANENK